MFLFRLIVNAVGFYLLTLIIPGIHIANFLAALIAVMILAIVNALIAPLVQIISIPVTILTLGVFALIVNGLLFWFGADLAPGVSISGFSAAFWGSLIYSLFTAFTGRFFRASSPS
jgi:putative membrane protein